MGVVKLARRAASQVGNPAPVTPSTGKSPGTDGPVPGMMPQYSAQAARSARSPLLPPALLPHYPAAELTARRPRRRCRDPGAARRRVHHGEWGCALRPRGLLRSS